MNPVSSFRNLPNVKKEIDTDSETSSSQSCDSSKAKETVENKKQKWSCEKISLAVTGIFLLIASITAIISSFIFFPPGMIGVVGLTPLVGGISLEFTGMFFLGISAAVGCASSLACAEPL